MADFTDGYEKIGPGQIGNAKVGKFPPFSSYGTEVTNEDKGPGPEWAKRPQKSDPGPT